MLSSKLVSHWSMGENKDHHLTPLIELNPMAIN